MNYFIYSIALAYFCLGNSWQTTTAHTFQGVKNIIVQNEEIQNSEESFMDYATLFVAIYQHTYPTGSASREEFIKAVILTFKKTAPNNLSSSNVGFRNDAVRIYELNTQSDEILYERLLSLEKKYPDAYPFFTGFLKLFESVHNRYNLLDINSKFIKMTADILDDYNSIKQLVIFHDKMLAVYLKMMLTSNASHDLCSSQFVDYNLGTNFLSCVIEQLNLYKSIQVKNNNDDFKSFLAKAIPVLKTAIIELNKTKNKKEQLKIYIRMQTVLFDLSWQYPETHTLMSWPKPYQRAHQIWGASQLNREIGGK